MACPFRGAVGNRFEPGNGTLRAPHRSGVGRLGAREMACSYRGAVGNRFEMVVVVHVAVGVVFGAVVGVAVA